MNIRRALDRDAQGIAYVHTESWKTTYRGIMPNYVLDLLTTESRLPKWERQLRTDEKDQILVVAEDGYGEIVGFA